MCKRLAIGLALAALASFSLPAQSDDIVFYIPDLQISEGESLCVPVMANGFEAVNFQFTVRWDPSELTFSGAVGNMPEGIINFGTAQAAQGMLTVVWNNTGNPLANLVLPDGAALFELCFSTINLPCGEPAALHFAGAPTPIFVYQLVGNGFDSLSASFQPGSLAQACAVLEAGGTANGDSLGAQGCAPFEVAFAGQALSSDSIVAWRWTFGDGHSSEAQNPVHVYQEAGSYTAWLVVSDGVRSDSVSLLIEAWPGPQVNLETDGAACPGDWLEAMLTGAVATIEWQLDGQLMPGQHGPSLPVQQSGQYAVIATDSAGCEARAEAHIELLEDVAPTLTGPATICQGDTVQLFAAGGVSYAWLSGAESLSASDVAAPYAFPRRHTAYAVLVSNACSEGLAHWEIEVWAPAGSVMEDTAISLGGWVQLQAFGGQAYAWQPSAYPVSDPASANPTAQPERSTAYVVHITDANGCASTHAIRVEVRAPLQDIFALPNVITPNGDGYNDYLVFEGLEEYHSSILKVFNRWGSIVYEKVGYENDWGGTHHGKPLPAGTYYYILNLGNQGGTLKSALTIIYE